MAEDEYDWTVDHPHWLMKQEMLAPGAWLFQCKRPPGYEEEYGRSSSYMPWAHLYVFSTPMEANNRVELVHYKFDEYMPLEIYSVELEIRKEFERPVAQARSTLEHPTTTRKEREQS